MNRIFVISLVLASLILVTLQDEDLLGRGRHSDSDHEKGSASSDEDKGSDSSDSSDSDSSDSSDSSDEEEEDEDRAPHCKVPAVKNGEWNVTAGSRLKIGEAAHMDCIPGFCPCDPTHDKPPNSTTLLCTKKSADQNTFCNLPLCTFNLTPLPGGDAKVNMVKDYMKAWYLEQDITWYLPYEVHAEKYLIPRKGLQISEVLKFNGFGVCNRHLAASYFSAFGARIKTSYRGGFAGCAVSSDHANIVVCVLYKF